MFDGKAFKLIAYADNVAIIVTEMPVNAQLKYEQHIARYLGMGTKYRSGYQRGENGYGTLYKEV